MPTVTTSLAGGQARKKIAIGLVAVFLLVLGGGLWWWQWQQTLKTDNQRFAHLLQSSEVLTGQAKYTEAAQAWTAYAPQARTSDHRRSAYLEAATLYMTSGQLPQVVQMCQKAESVSGVTYDEARLAAQAYTVLGDKSRAIHYYQEAISLVPKSLDDGPMMVSIFHQAIQNLQAQP